MVNEDIKGIEFKDGAIGKYELFLQSRFQMHPMWNRSLGTTLITAALGRTASFTLHDKWGAVLANPFFWYVGRSGLGIKSPPIVMTKKIIEAYNEHCLAPTSFNEDSFPEYVKGVKAKTNKDGKVTRNAIPPHPINICIVDEASRLLGQSKAHQYQENLYAFLCKLWDGNIEGKYTRGFQHEGNSDVFFSMACASSRDSYRLFNKQFWTVGLGNRMLWIAEDQYNAPELDETFFFDYKNDVEFQELTKYMLVFLHEIDECTGINITPEAGKTWINYANLHFKKIAGMIDDSNAQYSSKMPLNALKLAMCYCASRLNIDSKKCLWIDQKDMVMAIEDVNKYYRMWNMAMEQWADYIKEDKEEEVLKNCKYDVNKFVKFAIANNGVICVSEVQEQGKYPDRNKISSVMQVAEVSKFVEVCNRPDNQDNLTNEEFLRYKKQCGGRIPVVWRVTEKGKASCKVD